MSFFVMLMIGAILFGSNQIMPQLLQTAFPYTATLSGLAMMPGGIAMLVMMPVAGQITGHFQPKYLITVGLIGITLSMWYSTSLTPDASFDYFAWVRIYQIIALPFLFIPINTVAYDGLAANKTNQGSALMNVARNLGGSIGISVANVILTQRTQLHQARLVENTVPSSPAFQSTLNKTTQYFISAGGLACRRPWPSHRLYCSSRTGTGDDHGLYRCFPGLRHHRCNHDPDRANHGATSADRTGLGGGPLNDFVKDGTLLGLSH